MSRRLAGDSALILGTTLLGAGCGGIFWIVVARLASPHDVGLAGSLVTATVTIALMAQAGLDTTLVMTLPRSRTPAADVHRAVLTVGGLGLVLGLGYAAVIGRFSPALGSTLHDPWVAVGFAALVAATAINALTDAVFLSLRQLWSNLIVNGVGINALKLALPFALVGGAFSIVVSNGAGFAAAALASVVLLVIRLPRGQGLRWSPELRAARRFTMTSYGVALLDLAVVLSLPVIVVRDDGPARAAGYFLSFQIVVILHSVVYAINSSTYAEASRHPSSAAEVLRRGGLMLGGAVAVCAAVLVLAAPLALSVFGSSYAHEATGTLRVFAVGAFAVALNQWVGTRTRLMRRLRVMIGATAASVVVTIGLAVLWAPRGTAWVALAAALGQTVDGLLGLALVRWDPRALETVDQADDAVQNGPVGRPASIAQGSE